MRCASATKTNERRPQHEFGCAASAGKKSNVMISGRPIFTTALLRATFSDVGFVSPLLPMSGGRGNVKPFTVKESDRCRYWAVCVSHGERGHPITIVLLRIGCVHGMVPHPS